MTMLFHDLDATSASLPGLHAGQQELLILITELSGDLGEWAGPRSTLATRMKCSVDTVTRRKDALVTAGLIHVASCGRSLKYRLIKSAVESLPRLSDSGASSRSPATTPARRWWQRPAANQLDLFQTPATRQEAREALKATTMHWVGVLYCAIFGPDERPTTPATSPATSVAGPATLPTPSAAESTAQPAVPAADATQNSDKPTAIESPIGIRTPTSIPESNLLSPTNPTSTSTEEKTKSRALKFCLWPRAKKSDFQEPMKVEEVYERLLKVGGCTKDERLLVFKFIANAVELATPKDNLPGLITSVLRGAGTPWRARGNAGNERTAREMMRSIDVPPELQRRTGDLDLDARKAEQIAAMRKRGLLT